jgi:hypothetical protein
VVVQSPLPDEEMGAAVGVALVLLEVGVVGQNSESNGEIAVLNGPMAWAGSATQRDRPVKNSTRLLSLHYAFSHPRESRADQTKFDYFYQLGVRRFANSACWKIALRSQLVI